MKKLFLKLRYLLLAIVMLLACYVYVYFAGDEYVCPVTYILRNSTLIDVHQYTGTGRFIGMFIENTAGMIVVYFECILAGSIILSIRAARHIPAFDKDYILIVELIKKTSGKKAPKIAFSTTNYHVFRAGFLAARQHIRAEGIGSKTKSYFFINAFIREFIATVYYKLKTHFLVFAVLMMINVAVTLMTYVSNVLLS